jgi:hypothetical protein
MSLLDPAPWKVAQSRYVTLWHGCTSSDRAVIESKGIDVTVGRVSTDFGRGFYTTTIERQARHWAWLRYNARGAVHPPGTHPVVLRFRVDRSKLAELSWIAFVLGAFSNKDFWGLVQHCRGSTPTMINDHKGPVSEGGLQWYDVAYGPVAAFWEQRIAMVDSDQMSFHTQRAGRLLTDLIRSGVKRDYDWKAVK